MFGTSTKTQVQFHTKVESRNTHGEGERRRFISTHSYFSLCPHLSVTLLSSCLPFMHLHKQMGKGQRGIKEEQESISDPRGQHRRTAAWIKEGAKTPPGERDGNVSAKCQRTTSRTAARTCSVDLSPDSGSGQQRTPVILSVVSL